MLGSGVYKITNKLNGNFYIGSTVNFRKREGEHFADLRAKRHRNGHLQNAVNKYGIDFFVFEVIECCNPNDLLLREQHYLDTLDPVYNICPTAGNSLGRKHTDETKHKMSEANKGKPRSPDAVEKTRRALMGKPRPEHVRAIFIGNRKGAKHTDEAKEKMRLSKLGHVPSRESRIKRGKAVNSINPSTGQSLMYISIREADSLSGVDRASISRCIRGKQKTAGGLVWKYSVHTEG